MVVECEAHGSQTTQQLRVFGDWGIAKCPVCEKEADDRHEKQRLQDEIEAKERNRKYAIERHMTASGIPERFKTKDFDNYSAMDGNMRKAHALCQTYAKDFSANASRGTSMILCGHAGTGKTHLACAIVDYVIRNHCITAQYITIGKVFREVKNTYSRNSDDSEGDVILKFKRPELLVLDEIGVQYGSETEKNILFEIINERYEAMKPTVLISNLAMDSLVTFAGERVIDRLKENGGKLMIFDWKSHRGVAA